LILQCDAPDAVKASVKKGIGVGILFRARVGLEISTGELCQINVPMLRSIRARSFIIYRKNAALSSHALHFLDMLRAMKNDLP
jgi:DNA-binding transcriptional LysR family regulator